jgi:DNA-binding HxlR family transcriptional regulator
VTDVAEQTEAPIRAFLAPGVYTQDFLRYRAVPIEQLVRTQTDFEPASATLEERPLLSVGEVLGLLGTGAGGAILIALGPRPLRTKALTERVPSVAPRTVYRYAAKLAELGLVVRHEEGEVPSAVTYGLTRGPGRDLYRLLDGYLSAAWLRGPEGQVGEGAWTRLSLLGDLWDSGWIERLSREPCSPTTLGETTSGLTFHQANRRAHLVCSRGLLDQRSGRGRGVRYSLSDPARQGMALVTALGRWRQRHGYCGADTGLTLAEMTTVLRASILLVEVPEKEGSRFKLGVTAGGEANGNGGSETLVAEVGRGGRIQLAEGPEPPADGWALGTVNTWCRALLDGNRGRMRVGGDLELVDASLKKLHETLQTG